ncbi:MAG: hypothetical protein PHU71_06140 [Candidatus Gracilibacteria bacterium]|nr:hypothetical protein [Candidatus Gracilibacteria bacterium]
MESIIEKLDLKYFQKTGHSPEYSFWNWLAAIDASPTEEALKEIYDNIEEYI